MKVILSLLLSSTILMSIWAFPGPANVKEEVEIVPLEAQENKPDVETGVIEGPWFNPFDGFLDSFSGFIDRMRSQMDHIIRRLPFGNRTFDENGTFNFAGFDLGKGNTTSITKIIDGHKVVINETEYKHEGDDSGAFFKVRVIDILPNSSELTTEKDAEQIPVVSKDAESVENSFENEIPKNSETEILNSIELLDENDGPNKSNMLSQRSTRNEYIVENPPSDFFYQEPKIVLSDYKPFVNSNDEIDNLAKLETSEANWGNLETFDSYEDNFVENYKPIDLSQDTYVNSILADAGAPVNPDAIVFSPVEVSVPYPNQQYNEP